MSYFTCYIFYNFTRFVETRSCPLAPAIMPYPIYIYTSLKKKNKTKKNAPSRVTKYGDKE